MKHSSNYLFSLLLTLLLATNANGKDVKIGISNNIVRIVKDFDLRELLKARIDINKGLSSFIELKNIIVLVFFNVRPSDLCSLLNVRSAKGCINHDMN